MEVRPTMCRVDGDFEAAIATNKALAELHLEVGYHPVSELTYRDLHS